MKPPSARRSQRAGDAGYSLLEITILADERVRIAGDVDMATLGRLRSALASLPDSGLAIHLELADLRFIDVAGARDLVTFASSQPSRRLILHDPPRTMRRLLSLLWPRAAVEIQESAPRGARDTTLPPGWRPGGGTRPAGHARGQAGRAN